MDAPLNLPPELLDIHLSLERGGRLSPEQARMLMTLDDPLTLAALADAVAARKWGGRVFYGHPTRVPLRSLCEAACALCVDLDAHLERVAAVRAAEVHLVGLPDDMSLADVEAVVSRLRRRVPDLWIQGFTPAELDALARRSALDLDTVMQALQRAGLDGILGTHEEVYTASGRHMLPALDFSAALAVHAAAHRAGLVSIATLEYGVDESADDVVAHMEAIRDMQRKTAGFSVFAALPRDLKAGQRANETPSGYEDVRMVAVGRLFFDNIAHVRVPWLALGLKMGQVALSFGGDDLGWTALDPHVRQYAPSTAFTGMTAGELERLVRASRRHAAHVDGSWRERSLPVSVAPLAEASASCAPSCAPRGES